MEDIFNKCDLFEETQSQVDPRQVTVSITLSKTFVIDKGPHTKIDELLMRLEHFLPDEILKIVSEPKSEYREMEIEQMKSDAKDWIVDDLAVVEE